MKIEVELQPDVSVDDPEVQRLLKQLEEIRPQEDFRQELLRRFEGVMRDKGSDRIPGGRQERLKYLYKFQVEAVVEATANLIQHTELHPFSIAYKEGFDDLRKALLEKLK